MRWGRQHFVKKITLSGTGSFELIEASSSGTKLVTIHSMHGICSEDQVGTYGVIESNGGEPQISMFLASVRPQVLKDPAAEPISADEKQKSFVLTVQAVKAATNGFADIDAWIWGEYEYEDM